MNIVMIHGQNHKGSSYHIGHMIADKVNTEKDITEFFLPKDLNHFCLGCYQCIEGDANCPFYEEKNKIMTAVEAADLLIFTTPTYCLRASAPMKSFLDLTFTYWMSHRPRACMFSKKAVVVSTAAGAGAKAATKDISAALFYWGVPYITQLGALLQAMNWDAVSENNKRKLDKRTTKLAKKLANNKNPHVGFKTRFIFLVMGKMQAAGMGSSPMEKSYWKKTDGLIKNVLGKNKRSIHVYTNKTSPLRSQ